VFALVIAVVVLGVGCVLYGTLIEHSWYRLRRYRIAILPADGPPTLTVLHLSDLHFVRHDPKKARFIAGLPPVDVTIVTGDFLAEPEAVETAVAAVAPARGRLASWFVLGSNDYYAPRRLNYFAYFRSARRPRTADLGRAPELIAQLGAQGWDDLSNVRSEVLLGDLPVELLGLDDAHIRRQDYRVAPRRAPERFGIAVMHSPDSAPESAALGYRFMVAGHTHGGQVRLPMFGALVTNGHMPRRIVSGLIAMGTAVLHTSPGLGTSKYAPFRFCCRPEATILELTRAGEAGPAGV
jgi:predicted MPP superfamily phosphohydrolase